jgi:hypothetical protein
VDRGPRTVDGTLKVGRWSLVIGHWSFVISPPNEGAVGLFSPALLLPWSDCWPRESRATPAGTMNETFATLVRADLHGLAKSAGTPRFLCGGMISVAASCDTAGPQQVSPHQRRAASSRSRSKNSMLEARRELPASNSRRVAASVSALSTWPCTGYAGAMESFCGR